MQCNEIITPAIALKIGTTSTAKLESFERKYADDMSDFGQAMWDAICEELADREDQYAANRGEMNGVPPQY